MLICGCQGLAVLSLLASVALLSVQYEVNKSKGLHNILRNHFNEFKRLILGLLENRRKYKNPCWCNSRYQLSKYYDILRHICVYYARPKESPSSNL